MRKNRYSIGIANISSYTNDNDIDIIMNNLYSLYAKSIFLASNIGLRYHFYAGNDIERASGLTELQKRGDIDIIMFLRGGYGAIRVLKYLDTDTLSAYSKPMIGMSDLTALFIYYYQKTGKIAFHGPNLVSEFLSPGENENKADIFRKAMAKSGTPLISRKDWENLHVLSRGSARSRLIGGNLSTIASMAGTSYISPFSGHILFIEDTGERPYRVDRMLTQCFLAGLFDNLKAVLIGDFTQGVPENETGLFEIVFREHFSGRGYPVIMNMPFGHGKKKLTMPVGAMVEVDTCRKKIIICEDIQVA